MFHFTISENTMLPDYESVPTQAATFSRQHPIDIAQGHERYGNSMIEKLTRKFTAAPNTFRDTMGR